MTYARETIKEFKKKFDSTKNITNQKEREQNIENLFKAYKSSCKNARDQFSAKYGPNYDNFANDVINKNHQLINLFENKLRTASLSLQIPLSIRTRVLVELSVSSKLKRLEPWKGGANDAVGSTDDNPPVGISPEEFCLLFLCLGRFLCALVSAFC